MIHYPPINERIEASAFTEIFKEYGVKKVIYGQCDIDFIAGPSEVLVVADDSADVKLIAADMLAQCEHDKDARAYLITNSLKLAQNVQKEADEFLKTLKT